MLQGRVKHLSVPLSLTLHRAAIAGFGTGARLNAKRRVADTVLNVDIPAEQRTACVVAKTAVLATSQLRKQACASRQDLVTKSAW